jgi:hypothetical protein
MAEAQPVGFRWPMEAKLKGATLIHVDPRFTRMSAVCDLYVGIRSGSDIAFLGGLVNYVLPTTVGFMNTSWPTPMLRPSSTKVSGIPKIWQGCLAASTSSTSPMIPSRAIGATRSPRPATRSRTVRSLRLSPQRPARPSWPLQGWQRRTIYLAVQGHNKRTARPDLAASALRYADSAPALRPLHAGGRFPGVRLQAGRVCARRGIALHQLRTRADHLHCLRAGLDAAHHRRADHTHCRHLAIVARQHGPARRRHYGPARPLYHPGRDRHLDFVRHTARLPAATRCTRPRTRI